MAAAPATAQAIPISQGEACQGWGVQKAPYQLASVQGQGLLAQPTSKPCTDPVRQSTLFREPLKLPTPLKLQPPLMQTTQSHTRNRLHLHKDSPWLLHSAGPAAHHHQCHQTYPDAVVAVAAAAAAAVAALAAAALALAAAPAAAGPGRHPAVDAPGPAPHAAHPPSLDPPDPAAWLACPAASPVHGNSDSSTARHGTARPSEVQLSTTRGVIGQSLGWLMQTSGQSQRRVPSHAGVGYRGAFGILPLSLQTCIHTYTPCLWFHLYCIQERPHIQQTHIHGTVAHPQEPLHLECVGA